MQSCVPTVGREESDYSDGEFTPGESVSAEDSSDDEKSLGEISDMYTE